MKGRGYNFITLFLLLAFAGCEKDFDVGSIATETKMVVNCQIDNQRIIKVFVTESLPPTGNNQVIPITDAIVELYVNDSLKTILPFTYIDTGKTFGSYQLPEFGIPGTFYKVKITHPRYGTVITGDSLPLVPAVSSYQLQYYGNSADAFTTRFTLRFLDNALEKNYYRINIWQWGKSIASVTNGDTILQDYGYSARTEIAGTLEDTVREFNTYLLFSDRSFNGQQKQIDINAQGIDLSNVVRGYYTVELTQVSASHYNYYKSLETRNSFNDGNGNTALYSNVDNGYGIFMSNAIYSMTIPVK